MISRLIPLLLFSIASHAADDYCQTMRMDDSGGSMEKVRRHNQGDLNICQFHAMAQMIDAQLYSEVNPDYQHVTSPLALSLLRKASSAKTSWPRTPKVVSTNPNKPGYRNTLFFEFGNNFCNDFEALRDMGSVSCDEPRFVKYLATVIPKRKFYDLSIQALRFDMALKKIDRYGEEIKACDVEPATRVGENLFQILGPMNEALFRLGSSTKLIQAAQAACSTRHSKEINFKCKSELESRQAEFLLDQEGAVNLIHDSLSDANPQPMSLKFCMEILESRKGHSLEYSRSRGLKNCTLHAALIIGRRRSNVGKCQILIRNSMNGPCGMYANPENCEDEGVHYYIDEDHLQGNIADVARLTKMK